MTEMITILDIAKQLGVSKPVMITVRPYLVGFPRPKRVGKQQLYSAAGYKKWLKGRDLEQVAQMVRDAYANARHTRNKQNNKKRDSPLRQGDARAFLSGGFMTPEQRQQLAVKKRAANTTQPQTTCVTVVPDWMQD